MSDTPKVPDEDIIPPGAVRMRYPLYGGDVLSADGTVRLPFVLRNELIELDADRKPGRILEPAAERVQPECVHFGACGGCQYQMIAAHEQLTVKRMVLRSLLDEAGVDTPLGGSFDIPAHSGLGYGYRNRIRLRVERADGARRVGYNRRGTAQFLPITMCPIAAPLLWQTAETLLDIAAQNDAAAAWLDAASELEIFADHDVARVQLTFFCPPRTRLAAATFTKMMHAVSAAAPHIVGAGAVALDPRTGPTGKVFATFGADGLSYRVGEETYWISRGGFFQVNRFLLPKLVEIVCAGRGGTIAWDLFAGVGLFTRVLARSFAEVTAVEANPIAARDLGNALRKLGAQHRAVQATTLDFLRRAVLERQRPELVVLDPPRAGAGEDVCALLARLAPSQIVYVSCDPTTLAGDWKVLEAAGYRAATCDLVDLFPQTFHLETVVAFARAT